MSAVSERREEREMDLYNSDGTFVCCVLRADGGTTFVCVKSSASESVYLYYMILLRNACTYTITLI